MSQKLVNTAFLLRKFVNTAYLSRKFINTHLSIDCKDLLDPSISPQIVPPCITVQNRFQHSHWITILHVSLVEDILRHSRNWRASRRPSGYHTDNTGPYHLQLFLLLWIKATDTFGLLSRKTVTPSLNGPQELIRGRGCNFEKLLRHPSNLFQPKNSYTSLQITLSNVV